MPWVEIWCTPPPDHDITEHFGLEQDSTARQRALGVLVELNLMDHVEDGGKPHHSLLLGTDVSRGFVVSVYVQSRNI